MPRLPETAEDYDNETNDLIEQGEQKARRFLDGFMDFVFSDNILEIAFGLILANGFTALTNSFVSDIVLPPLSIILPLHRNLDEKFAVLKAGPRMEELEGYNTLAQAQDDGAVVLAYGLFLNKVFNFVGMGLALYALALIYQYASHDPIIKHTVKCRYCRKSISEKARRCVNCTSWLDGREERIL